MRVGTQNRSVDGVGSMVSQEQRWERRSFLMREGEFERGMTL